MKKLIILAVAFTALTGCAAKTGTPYDKDMFDCVMGNVSRPATIAGICSAEYRKEMYLTVRDCAPKIRVPVDLQPRYVQAVMIGFDAEKREIPCPKQ